MFSFFEFEKFETYFRFFMCKTLFLIKSFRECSITLLLERFYFEISNLFDYRFE